MVGTIGTARQPHGLALAAAAALLLTSGIASAQVAGINGSAPSLGVPGNAAPAVGGTGIPLGATGLGGAGLSPVLPNTTFGIAPSGSNVTSNMGTGGLGLGATQTSNAGLSPVPLDTTLGLPPLGSDVTGTMSTGAMSTGGLAAPATAMPGVIGSTSPPGSGLSPVTMGQGSSALSPGTSTQAPGVTNFGVGGVRPLPGSPGSPPSVTNQR